MDNVHIFSKAPEFQPNIHEAKLAELLDWCQLVQDYLNSGQTEDAKFFLAQAIADAKRPVDSSRRVSPP
ncbi:hypothetical protein WA1_02300 [Scytonema hofmannii PCC 7110]|uniref:Uncharacterized protein n=1 Tax=Scytonema hofmannii PCC 7110 TaxID=128403 RepID=A0A139XH23_9CYAN|nr:hypothetical protein [Scytonema hofmannii]KYC43997.1 hypothetical protein WA1_02300 [Scytonema hofmannii PCC 7110]